MAYRLSGNFSTDVSDAAIGTGTVGNGMCNISLGTSGTVFISGDSFKVDKNNALHYFAHANGTRICGGAKSPLWKKIGGTVEPEEELSSLYEIKYQQFRNIYPAVRGLF